MLDAFFVILRCLCARSLVIQLNRSTFSNDASMSLYTELVRVLPTTSKYKLGYTLMASYKHTCTVIYGLYSLISVLHNVKHRHTQMTSIIFNEPFIFQQFGSV